MSSTSVEVSLVGTEGYLPPEGPGAPTADIYALGKVLYEAATGLHRAKFPELPTLLVAECESTPAMAPLNKIILKACADHPSQRFQSAAALRDALAALLSEKRAGSVESTEKDRLAQT